MRTVWAGVALATGGSMAMAQVVPPPVVAKTAMTTQQTFEAATELTTKGEWAEALAAWEALERRPRMTARAVAIIRVRKGYVLSRLGQDDAAAEVLRLGLAALPASDATLADDRFLGERERGLIAYRALDYATAADALTKAGESATDNGDRLTALTSLTTVQTFLDPAAAEVSLAKLKALAATMTLTPSDQGNILVTETELLLNQGRFRDAAKTGRAAVNAYGGLSASKIQLDDAVARSDAAIAMLLAGEDEDARKFLAYSGAGHSTKEFARGLEMPVPLCGAEDGLKPDDVAVVEFNINEDGTISSTRPVYAVGGGAAGLAFARAARDWSFDSKSLKTLPAFFRNKARVEVRCSTAFPRPSLNGLIDSALVRWLDERGSPAVDKVATAVAWRRDLARLAQLEQQGVASGAPLIAVLASLAANPLAPREDANLYATRAQALLDDRAPPLARLSIDLRVLATSGTERRRAGVYQAGVRALLAKPVYRDDPQARAVIRLLLADGLGRRQITEAKTLLDPVAQDAQLPATDAFKIGALIRLASLNAREGKAEEARKAFERSGLDGEQCALADAAPKLVSIGGVFPQEAERWGFEGWTTSEVDVGADGSVPVARPIISYPPFVFTKAGVETVKGARYTKSYRPSGGIGCRARPMSVKFSLGE
ncbi:MAG: hypothetical protein K2Y20_01455 [Sphingomonas sp.]|nr:hypothetical protein [Sphingomonas sp.]